MRILLTGASGFIGQEILFALLRKKFDVVAAVRNTQRFNVLFPGVKTIKVDFCRDTQAESWVSRLHDIDVVINSVGIISETHQQTFRQLHTKTPIALFQACEIAGVNKVIQISALGVRQRAISEYQRSKALADEYLRQRNFDWIILQPSLVYGNRGQSTSLFRAMAALPLIPLPNNGSQQLQPVHIDDLVDLVSKLVCTNNIRRTTIPVVGPCAITFKEMLETFRQGLGLGKTITVSIPNWLAYFAVSILGPLGNKFLNRENLAMLQHGNTADCTRMVRAAGRVPRSIGESTFTKPLSIAERFYARSYFLKPLLRISLAIVWISSGLVSLFIYPIDTSNAMLLQVGVPQTVSLFVLYFAAGLDIFLGIVLLLKYRLCFFYSLQIIVIISYSLILTIGFPELWGDPFGPLTKNIPIIIATLILMVWEE